MLNRKKHSSILVVDDDPDVREATSLLLDEFGYTVVSSASADEAIHRLETDHIDVIITDIVMPSVSGIELLRRVHDIDPQIPVILMTAFADMEKVINAIKIGHLILSLNPSHHSCLSIPSKKLSIITG